MPNPYLEWVDENQQVHRLEIVEKVFIGRSCRGIEETKRIIVDDPFISRDHAVVSRRASHLRIADTSKNGTWINDVRVTAGSSHSLENGDIIKVGIASFRVFCTETTSQNEKYRLPINGTVIIPTKVVVTNLVADVRGFSGFSQDHDSNQVYALMNEIISRFNPITEKFKGTIKDYAGDAVYAFWDHTGGPQNHRAVLACRAAIKQTQIFEQIRKNLASENPAVENMRMGWGITTGKVTMAHYGSRAVDLALVGDCTNLAFRLSGIANKDLREKIVICSQTANLIRNTLSVIDLGDVNTRGRSGKEHVFGLSEIAAKAK